LSSDDSSYHHQFPPELGVIDYAQRFECPPKHTAVWRRPDTSDATRLVYQHGDGWVAIKYPYGRNTSSYAYCRLVAPAPTRVWLHLRSDDDLTVFHSGKMLLKLQGFGAQGSSRAPWRADRVADEFSLPLDLPAGPSPLLIKITNQDGDAGFVAALVGSDGKPPREVTIDLEPPAAPAALPAANAFKKLVLYEGDGINAIKPTVGSARTVTRQRTKDVLIGTSDRQGVVWRRYDIHPGFPRDAPSNLFWLPATVTRKLGDFILELDLVLEREGLPKIAVTISGDGESDGLSGWTLVLVPDRDERTLMARLEKYDLLTYSSPRLAPPRGTTFKLNVMRVGEQLSATLDGAKLFDRASIPALPDRSDERIGFSLWNQRVGVSALRLRR
jgi:hypothetical protein